VVYQMQHTAMMRSSTIAMLQYISRLCHSLQQLQRWRT
jgi:hypothetical protein